MERAYRQGTVYAIILVSLVTAFTLRRTRETVLALLPLGLGLMWAFGLMYVFGLTTIVGFGSLMIANHRGIFGLGLLLTLGTATSLLAALIVLPVLLRMVPARTGPLSDRLTDRDAPPLATATRGADDLS